MLSAQVNLDSVKKKFDKEPNHIYAGIELGCSFIFSTLEAEIPANQYKCDNVFDGRFEEEIMIIPNFNIGGKFKSHYFELGVGGYSNYGRGDYNAAKDFYGALQFSYFYQLPIRSNRVNLLVGPNIGWAFRTKNPKEVSTSYYTNNYVFQTRSLNPGDNLRNMVAGFSLRCDVRLGENFSFISKINTSYLYIAKDYYVDLGNDNLQTPEEMGIYHTKTNWNVALFVGIKIRFNK